MTYQRNIDYRSALSIWEDTVAKRPNNDRARKNLGMVLITCGRPEEAVFHLRKALKTQPDNAETHSMLATALVACNQHEEAQVHFRRSLELDPDNAEVHNDFAAELAKTGHVDEAIAHFREVLRLRPGLAGIHYNLGMIMLSAQAIRRRHRLFSPGSRTRSQPAQRPKTARRRPSCKTTSALAPPHSDKP